MATMATPIRGRAWPDRSDGSDGSGRRREPGRDSGRARPRELPAASLAVALAAALAGVLALSGPAPAQEASADRGKILYDRWCAGCHGVEGDGEGPAARYMMPPPRDFTKGVYQIRTTPSGSLPLDADIMRVIDEGMPGTAMPGWEGHLSEADRRALVEHLKSFSRFFGALEPEEPYEPGSAPSVSGERLERGEMLYDSIECWKCHGEGGRGDGSSAPTLENDAGDPVRAADLTENWLFNGGGTVEEIYMRLRTGLDGTPMPSFSDLVQSGFMTEDDLWSLAHYVRSFAPEERPEVRDVIRAGLVEGELPSVPDDPAWEQAEESYVPLVGQIIEEPRWFNPRVDGVYVKALHDGESLALRLAWNDPSESPDPAWSDWQERVVSFMEPDEGKPDAPLPLPDVLSVQFPRELDEGMERPYFLMGDTRRPVYLWTWRSDGGVTEENASGPGTQRPQPEEGRSVRATARWAQGRWRLVLRRSLVTDDENDLREFPAGVPVPAAFFAWDGDNGESGKRGAVSSWYFVYLEEPTPATVYFAPLVAVLLTAGLGVLVVARAQRRERDVAGSGERTPEGPEDPSSKE